MLYCIKNFVSESSECPYEIPHALTLGRSKSFRRVDLCKPLMLEERFVDGTSRAVSDILTVICLHLYTIIIHKSFTTF